MAHAATLRLQELVGDVRAWVTDLLHPAVAGHPFVLYTTPPPMPVPADDVTLAEAHMLPATLLYMAWGASIGSGSAPLLTPAAVLPGTRWLSDKHAELVTAGSEAASRPMPASVPLAEGASSADSELEAMASSLLAGQTSQAGSRTSGRQGQLPRAGPQPGKSGMPAWFVR
jgi:hypothetical protein